MRFYILIPVIGALLLGGAGCSTYLGSKTTEPAVAVESQDLGEKNQIVIKKASITENGWVVIYSKENGQKGPVIGYQFLPAGSSSKIKITVDRKKVTPSLVAVLHYDRNKENIFEFPGSDGPVFKDQKLIEQEFTILNQGSL
jgi:hypothetical protein